MPVVTFIMPDNTRHACDVPEGSTLLQAARQYDIDLEGECEGSLACSTCHVVVDQEGYDLLPEAKEDEEDMLDLAFDVQPTSRLGCQIVMTAELDGLVVRVPASV